jgi:hypothetical protein
MAELEGISKASSVPVTDEITRIGHGSTAPLWISLPVPNVATANINRVNRTIFKRLNLSARTPPHIEKIRTGAKFAVATSPSMTSEPVSVRIRKRRP